MGKVTENITSATNTNANWFTGAPTDSNSDGIPDNATFAFFDYIEYREEMDIPNFWPDADPPTDPEDYEDVEAHTTDPTRRDTDGDYVPDGTFYLPFAGIAKLYKGEDRNNNGKNSVVEDSHETNPRDNDSVPEDCLEDTDNDNLSDIYELAIGTNIYDKDTDDDGIMDGDEYKGEGPNEKWFNVKTDPLDPDTDGDGLPDGLELGVSNMILGYNDPEAPDGRVKGTAPETPEEEQPIFVWYKDDGTELERYCFIPDQDPTTLSGPKEYDTNHNGIGDGEEDSATNGIMSHHGWISYKEYYSYDDNNAILLQYSNNDQLSEPYYVGTIAYYSDHLDNLEFRANPLSSFNVQTTRISSNMVKIDIYSFTSNSNISCSIVAHNTMDDDDSDESINSIHLYDPAYVSGYFLNGKIYIISDVTSHNYLNIRWEKGKKIISSIKAPFIVPMLFANGLLRINDYWGHEWAITQAYSNISLALPNCKIYFLEDEDRIKVADFCVDPTVVGFFTVGHGERDEFYTRNMHYYHSYITPKDLKDAMGRKNSINKKWPFIININCLVNEIFDKGAKTDRFPDLITDNGFYWGYKTKINLSIIALQLNDSLWIEWSNYWLNCYPNIKKVFIHSQYWGLFTNHP